MASNEIHDNARRITTQFQGTNLTSTFFDTLGNVSGMQDALGFRTTVTHDAFNNIVSMQTADGAMTTNVWGYAGSSFDTTGAKRRLQAQVDALGPITSWSLNGRGQAK